MRSRPHAARCRPRAPSMTDAGRLFITGYSQGGYVAMATHRAMQEAGRRSRRRRRCRDPTRFRLSGRRLLGSGDRWLAGEPDAPVDGYQHSYGDVYASTTDVFEAQYATDFESLLPSDEAASELNARATCPTALFSSTPPDPAFAAITPATTPRTGGGLRDRLRRGAPDDQRFPARLPAGCPQPRRRIPVTVGRMPPADPDPLRQALKPNDLRNWTPTRRRCCAGATGPAVSI